MPFTSTTELPSNPDVRVFFTGLLILDPNPEDPPIMGVNTCEVFVHRSAPNHRLSIEVRRKRQNKPDIIMMRHLGQLDFMPPEDNDDPRFGMFVVVFGSTRGVRRFDPDGPASASPQGEGLGFAIDLDHLPTQEGGAGPVKESAGRPSILLNDAVFYTAAKTHDGLDIGLKKNDAVVVEKLPPFATVIGANIYLDQGQIVVMQWVQQGLFQTLELKKPEEAGLSYEIYIVNEPLYEADESPLPDHDELMEYFNILPQAGERFALQLPDPNAGPVVPPSDRGSTKTPCMSVIKSG